MLAAITGKFMFEARIFKIIATGPPRQVNDSCLPRSTGPAGRPATAGKHGAEAKR
jgi:hypothetical protein